MDNSSSSSSSSSSLTATHANIPQEEVDDDWEEWDGKGPFWVHCVAGSAAGVAEHVLVYPLDTVRTHIQVCASCVHRNATSALSAVAKSGSSKTAMGKASSSPLRGALRTPASGAVTSASSLPTGMWQTMRFLMNEPAAAAALTAPRPATGSIWAAGAAAASPADSLIGMTRLWRGVETILLGCIPAHALYFGVYESLKSAAPRNQNGEVAMWASSLTGAAATMAHDMVMTPLDTVKQRMQLGHYKSTYRALAEIMQKETGVALYRSFPITLATNIPYGMVFMPINEHAKAYYGQQQSNRPAYVTVLLASSTAGFVASAVTTPLDRIKTALQTQTLAPACLVNPEQICQSAKAQQAQVVLHKNWQQAARHIWQTEGFMGFWRGLAPRVLSHTPALAISWTTYEAAKQALLKQYQ